MATYDPTEALPNRGVVQEPDITDPHHAGTIASIAGHKNAEKRLAETLRYAEEVVMGRNGRLYTVCHRIQERLAQRRQNTDQQRDRHDQQRGREDLTKRVISAADAVKVDKMSIALAFFTFLAAFGLAFGEGKLLANTVMYSGVLGLTPDKWSDWWFAGAFAMPTIAVALLKRSHHEALEPGEERSANWKKVYRSAIFWFLLWLPTAALLFGPSMLSPGTASTDPFQEFSTWAETAVGGLGELKVVLDVAGFVFVALLLIFNILMCSTVGAAILILERELYAKGKKAEVRTSEEYLLLSDRIDAMDDDIDDHEFSGGELAGIIKEIENTQNSFARQLYAEVKSTRARAKNAFNSELYGVYPTNVIDATEQFARR